MKSLHGRSRVVSISRGDGSRVDDPKEVKTEFVAFFQKLLSAPPSQPEIDRDLLGKVLPRRLSREQREELDKVVTEEEVRSTIFSLKDGKAPGPDGFNALFFKRAWGIVGKFVVKVIPSFFNSGKLLKSA